MKLWKLYYGIGLLFRFNERGDGGIIVIHSFKKTRGF